MTQAEISGISPFFIVSHVPSSLSFTETGLDLRSPSRGLLLTTSSSASFAGAVRRSYSKMLAWLHCRTTSETSKKVSPAGTHSLTSRILTHWRTNLLRAMSSFPSH